MEYGRRPKYYITRVFLNLSMKYDHIHFRFPTNIVHDLDSMKTREIQMTLIKMTLGKQTHKGHANFNLFERNNVIKPRKNEMDKLQIHL